MKSKTRLKTVIQFYMIYLYYPKRNDEDWISVQQKEIKRLQAKNVELSRKRQKIMNEKDDIRLARVEIKSLKELNQKLTDSNEGTVLYYYSRNNVLKDNFLVNFI